MLYQSAGHGAYFYNEHRYHHYRSDNDGESDSDSNSNGLLSSSPPPPPPRNDDEPEPDHDHVFRPLWRAFFTPSPAVQAILDRERQALRLTTDQYVAVHIRSQYQNYNSDLQIRTMVRHAMNCASQLQLKQKLTHNPKHKNLKHLPLSAGGATDAGSTNITMDTTIYDDTAAEPEPEPIFVATDSSRAATAVAAYGKRRNAPYVRQRESTLAESDAASSSSASSSSSTSASASEPLHLDRGSAHLNRNASGWTTAQDPADYYDTFVDLYLLAGSRCITYHVGGYGRWANLLSSNITCEMNHLKNKCSWRAEPTMEDTDEVD
jgi:hypothetical protein